MPQMDMEESGGSTYSNSSVTSDLSSYLAKDSSTSKAGKFEIMQNLVQEGHISVNRFHAIADKLGMRGFNVNTLV